MLLNINRNSPIPIFDQLVGQIRQMIDEGLLEEGYKMPSTRQLSISLDVNRTTVVKVYEELWALGYLESTSGSYTKVRLRKKISVPAKHNSMPASATRQLFDTQNLFELPQMDRYAQLMKEPLPGVIDFYHLVPDPRLIDKRLITNCFREVMADSSMNIFGYNQPRGLPALRQVIATHMQLHSIHATDDNILITNGSQNSLQLIFQTFAQRGDTIAIEAPTYAMLFPLIRFYGLNVVEIESTDTGFDLEELSRQIEIQTIRFIYVIPTFQNPTGSTMPQQNREELLSLCEHHSIILIEDSIEEEMKYFGKVHLPIKSMDKHDHVIYLGSFSKVLAPGFRTAWIIAPIDCIRRITIVKMMSDITSNTLSQAIIYRFCRLGYYELHLRRMMRIFRRRMKTALKALKKWMPAGMVSWKEPLGGFIIWLEITADPPADVEAWFQQHGVRITDGSLFYYTPRSGFRIRISISKCNDQEIEEGMKRIGAAIRTLGE
ncbi:MAG TPA: hypothetical protein DCR43_02010 [Bacteroidales bacterium]|nr:MAG: hypothetical protein A2X11_06740 [Bacteroidetes bacterium GWE2_42_24]OFY24959.1 MAG: hypothetical protein A2X09_13250 [Bacteroidetes bacterium GWF2_43_11]PKP25584.1 MAG: hypothetical protein CVU06_04065 [Bacteroidetes bacterium HGW-Bacteroidetes-22]HAQ64623.1 hypothetical protein [Bacteroidales bacterium]HBZ68034.1 hypothetical protein [Bacteroidales bacterium]